MEGRWGGGVSSSVLYAGNYVRNMHIDSAVIRFPRRKARPFSPGFAFRFPAGKEKRNSGQLSKSETVNDQQYFNGVFPFGIPSILHGLAIVEQDLRLSKISRL